MVLLGRSAQSVNDVSTKPIDKAIHVDVMPCGMRDFLQ